MDLSLYDLHHLKGQSVKELKEIYLELKTQFCYPNGTWSSAKIKRYNGGGSGFTISGLRNFNKEYEKRIRKLKGLSNFLNSIPEVALKPSPTQYKIQIKDSGDIKVFITEIVEAFEKHTYFSETTLAFLISQFVKSDLTKEDILKEIKINKSDF